MLSIDRSLTPCADSSASRTPFAVVQVLKEELAKVCEGAEVVEKVGQIEIVGDYRKPVREYLLGLGF